MIFKNKIFLRMISMLLLIAMSMTGLISCDSSSAKEDGITTSDDSQGEDSTTLESLEEGTLGADDPLPTPDPEKPTPPENPTTPLYTISKKRYGDDVYGCNKITVLAEYNQGVDYDIYAVKNTTEKVFYLFLPCRADLSAVTFTVTHTDDSLTGPYTVDFSDDEVSFNERVVMRKPYVNEFATEEYTIVVMQSNLPSVMVQIDEQYVTINQMNNDPDHKTFSYGDMVATVTDELAAEKGWATRYESVDSNPDKYCSTDMRGRGNWNWKYPKRSYQIRTENQLDLFGMGRGKTWALLGLYNDPAGIRTQIINDVAENLGVRYTSAHRMIDLFLNGKYMGMFVMTEKVEVEPNRVAIDQENDILFEVDQYYEEQGEYGCSFFEFEEECHFRIHSPTIDGTSEASKAILYEALTALYSGNEKEFLKYFDTDSWARMLLTQLASMNHDAYRGSFYFYYNNTDGKLYACSPWDFDWSLGNCTHKSSSFWDPMKNDFSNVGLSKAMIEYPSFLEAVLDVYYKDGGKEAIAAMPDLARKYGAEGRRTLEMNALVASINYHKEVNTPGEALEFLYTVCEKRVEFMEQKMSAIAKQINYQQ